MTDRLGVQHVNRGDGYALCSGGVAIVPPFTGRRCLRCARVFAKRKTVEKQRRAQADYVARMRGEVRH